jgi:hypothetical protein
MLVWFLFLLFFWRGFCGGVMCRFSGSARLSGVVCSGLWAVVLWCAAGFGDSCSAGVVVAGLVLVGRV